MQIEYRNVAIKIGFFLESKSSRTNLISFFSNFCTGEQEKPAVNLEKIHEATVRQTKNAVDTTKDAQKFLTQSQNEIEGENGRESGGDVGPPRMLMESIEEEPIVGPVLGNEELEIDSDPYNLPITHEVTLEGINLFKVQQNILLCFSTLSVTRFLPGLESKTPLVSMKYWCIISLRVII